MSALTKEKMMLALAGKALERGLDPQWPPQNDGLLFINLEEVDRDKDHLHQQVLRNLVSRLNGNGKLHITKADKGLLVEYVPISEAEPATEDNSEAEEAKEVVEETPEVEVSEEAAPVDRVISALQQMMEDLQRVKSS